MSTVFDRRRFLANSAVAAGTGAALAGWSPGAAAAADRATPNEIEVHVNNIGHAPDAPKRAIIAAPEPLDGARFTVLDAATGDAVFSGNTEQSGQVADWGEQHYRTADFSELSSAGRYLVRVEPGNGPPAHSAPFRIAEQVLER